MTIRSRALWLGLVLVLSGCGVTAGIFSSRFTNAVFGGRVPVTPGPAAAFVFVRCINETGVPAEFIVTVEREVPIRDAEGNIQIDALGDIVTRSERQTRRLLAGSDGLARETGTLFSCQETPVTFVGLGENLQATDTAVTVGGQGTGGAAGFGVPAGNLAPLELSVGNFNCGDTVIYDAFLSNNAPSGVGLQVFLLPGSEQPSVFEGPSTFANYQDFLDAQQVENQP